MVLGGDNFIIKLRHSTKHYLLGEHLPIVVMVVVISGVTVVGLAVLVGWGSCGSGFSGIHYVLKNFIMTVQLQR